MAKNDNYWSGFPMSSEYSEDLISHQSKSGNISNPDFVKIGFLKVLLP